MSTPTGNFVEYIYYSQLIFPRNSPIDSLYVTFQTLKLKDMIKLEFAQFFLSLKISASFII